MCEDKKSCITINCGCCGSGNSNGDGSDSTPVGTVISYMGTSAPEHYFICDGTIYNIADYKDFSQFIRDQFGSYNYFDGDGTVTFAVPDLRNEFLRGYHGDKEEKLSSDIGIHQNGSNQSGLAVITYDDRNPVLATAIQSNGKQYSRGGFTGVDILSTAQHDTYSKQLVFNTDKIETITWDNDPVPVKTSSRPTNTTVLYCIKYE